MRSTNLCVSGSSVAKRAKKDQLRARHLLSKYFAARAAAIVNKTLDGGVS